MAFNKRAWKGRQGTGLNKFSINGATPVTVVNQPDSITEVGDALSARNLNDLENRIAEAFDETASQEEVTNLSNALSQKTRNLFTGGNEIKISPITGYWYSDGMTFPAGTYIVSALITSDVVYSRSLIRFEDDNGAVGAVELERSSTNRKSGVVTLTAEATKVFLFGGGSVSESIGHNTTWYDLQIEKGDFVSKYIEPISADDLVDSEWIANDSVYGKSIRRFVSGALDVYDTAGIVPSVKKDERFFLNCNVTAIGTLAFGLYKTSLNDLTNHVTVDSTNLTVYSYDGSSSTAYAHGLTIANNLTILIESNSAGGANITLVSNGEIFKQSVNWSRRYMGTLYVRETNGSNISDVTMGWTCKDFNRDLWFFGDSYFSYTDRWYYYFRQYGYADNVLMDAYPGEGSTSSLQSLYRLLEFGLPKCVVWCLGMNDGSDDGEPSSTWMDNINRLTTLCTKLGIKLILSTTPTVPTINHQYKNAWVKASGYRYIDFANAVGAQADGTWYSGMLSSDGVHPTAKGARALFAQVMVDVPEVMISD